MPAMLACGCALVSGLSQINVSDGGGAIHDASDVEDVNMPVSDAGLATALQLKTTCASTVENAGLSFSAMPFTVSFWFRPDMPSSFTQDIRPIVWNGGRNTAEPGWLIGTQAATLVFCASDVNASACAISGPMFNAVNHLIHIVGVSNPGGLNRSLQIWSLDATNGQTSHVMLGQSASAPNNWTSTEAFTVGGVGSNNRTCSFEVQGVIDDLRLWSAALTPAQLDSSYKQPLSCSDTNLAAYFKFDEGAGTTATSCAGKNQLTLGGTYAWLPSPF